MPPHGYGWAVERAEEYIETLVEIAESSGGAIVESGDTVTDCPDYEVNRILERVAAGGSMLIVIDDTDLTSTSPWRGTPIVTTESSLHARTQCVEVVDGRWTARETEYTEPPSGSCSRIAAEAARRPTEAAAPSAEERPISRSGGTVERQEPSVRLEVDQTKRLGWLVSFYAIQFRLPE